MDIEDILKKKDFTFKDFFVADTMIKSKENAKEQEAICEVANVSKDIPEKTPVSAVKTIYRGKALMNKRRMDFEKIHINFDTSPIKPNSTYSLIVENGEDGWRNANGYTLEN